MLVASTYHQPHQQCRLPERPDQRPPIVFLMVSTHHSPQAHRHRTFARQQSQILLLHKRCMMHVWTEITGVGECVHAHVRMR
jgi:hypothetical protein